MQQALRANSSGRDFRSGSGVAATRVNKFLIAGVTVAGAAAIAVNPAMSNIATDAQNGAAAAEYRAIKLASDVTDVLGDYESVVSQAGANLQTLGSEASVALPALLQTVGSNLSEYGGLIGTALKTTATTLFQDALYGGGWYGGDDGYVFALFGGNVTSKAGVTEYGSTLQEVFNSLAKGNVFNAFSYIEEWALEALQHVTKPLLAPFLNTAKAGATATETIPGDILQTLTNLNNQIFTYSNLQSLVKAFLSPVISVAYGALGSLSNIATAVSKANIGAAVADVLKLPADLTGDLLNGYVYPSAVYNPTGAAFTGLLNSGSLLQDLLVTWPNQLAKALGITKATTTAATTTAATTAAVTAAAVSTPSATTAAADSGDATATATTTSKKRGKKDADAAADSATSVDNSATSSDAATSTSSTSSKKQGHKGSSSAAGDSKSESSDSAASTSSTKHGHSKDGTGSHSSHSGSHGSNGGHK